MENKQLGYFWMSLKIIVLILLLLLLLLLPFVYDNGAKKGVADTKKVFASQMELWQDGFNDNYISNIADYIKDCTPANPEAFVWVDLQGKENGVLLKCGNSTYPLKYSQEYFKRSYG